MQWNCSLQKRISAISEKFQQTEATERVSETFGSYHDLKCVFDNFERKKKFTKKKGSDENFLVERKMRSRNMLVVLTSVVLVVLISLSSLVKESVVVQLVFFCRRHILHIYPITLPRPLV